MGTSLLNFDWWVLVIVPAMVTIAVTYIQRGLDFTAKNFFPSWKKIRLRKEIKDTLRILRRMSDGTVQYTIASHAAVTVIRGTITIGTVILLTVAFDLHVRERGWLSTAGIIFTEAMMMWSFIKLNKLITLISRYNRTFNYPVETVQTLRLKQATILEDEFGDQLQGAEMLATRLMAARIQHMRDTLGEFERERLEPVFMRDYEIEGGLRPE